MNTENEKMPAPTQEGRELTFGEKAVGLTFNPGNNPMVDACKRGFATEIDRMHELRNDPMTPSEGKRHASIAITELESAQMRAVKAITWRD